MAEETAAERLEKADKILAEPYLKGTLPGSNPLKVPDRIKEKVSNDGYELRWIKTSDYQTRLETKQGVPCDEPGTPELPDLKLIKIRKEFVEAYKQGVSEEARAQLQSVSDSELEAHASRPSVGKGKKFFVMGGKK